MYTRKSLKNVTNKVCTAVQVLITITCLTMLFCQLTLGVANTPEHVIRTGTEEIREEYVAMYNSGSLIHTIKNGDAEVLEDCGLTFIHTVDLLNRTYEGSNGYFMYVVNLEDNTCKTVKNDDGSDMTVNQWLDKMLVIWNS